jgi:arsenate reductase (glutaredoxin)
MTTTIWHKPNCSTSLYVLRRLREAGIEPQIYLYLEERPTKAEIEAVLKKLKLKPSDLLRSKEPEAAELADASDAKILAAMVKHPILIERPIVISKKGAILVRPKERIEELL